MCCKASHRLLVSTGGCFGMLFTFCMLKNETQSVLFHSPRSAHLIKLIQSCAFLSGRPHYLCLLSAGHLMTPLSLSPCYTCLQQGVMLTPLTLGRFNSWWGHLQRLVSHLQDSRISYRFTPFFISNSAQTLSKIHCTRCHIPAWVSCSPPLWAD